jgi:hypothetical protein
VIHIYKFLFDLIKEPLGIFDNPLHDWIVLGIIELVAYIIAWRASPGGRWGSEIHWTVRTLVFIVIWAIVKGVVELIKLLLAIPLIVWIFFGVAVVVVSTVVIVILINKRKHKVVTN